MHNEIPFFPSCSLSLTIWPCLIQISFVKQEVKMWFLVSLSLIPSLTPYMWPLFWFSFIPLQTFTLYPAIWGSVLLVKNLQRFPLTYKINCKLLCTNTGKRAPRPWPLLASPAARIILLTSVLQTHHTALFAPHTRHLHTLTSSDTSIFNTTVTTPSLPCLNIMIPRLQGWGGRAGLQTSNCVPDSSPVL